MELSQAKEVIYTLSQGIDPASGEVLADNSCFNQPVIIRALFLAHEALEKSVKYQQRKSSLPPNAGKPWPNEEDEQLAGAFDTGTSIAQLAKAHQRTPGSIKARLEKLGKITGA
ncbi:hypothetical protein [uncultured Alteromonas sp.]|jgi:hypothetical protein|uniref:hypothetical protein n=1 Tax=uncultured Alteromonas sp. TaxID=179113 RepID=UPI0025D1593C|nr:hypothetical protein [uncultured Alteromonas sp.]